MDIHVRSEHIALESSQEDYIKSKLEVLKKYSERIKTNDEAVQVWVYVERNRTLEQKEKVLVKVNMSVPGATFRAEVSALTPEEGIDAVHDKLHRQIERYKSKHMHEERVTHEQLAELMAEGEGVEHEGKDLRITVRKLFTDLFPMTESEAIEQMKMLGHTFFIFVNAATDRYNVVYERPDKKSYGLVELEMQEGVLGNG
jgi:ribosomal subunit interface protein